MNTTSFIIQPGHSLLFQIKGDPSFYKISDRGFIAIAWKDVFPLLKDEHIIMGEFGELEVTGNIPDSLITTLKELCTVKY